MAVKSTVETAYLSCLINRFTFRPKPRTRTPFQLIDHVDHDDVHYRDRGIPRELVRRWSEQHRRRNKTIRKLETYQV